MPRVQQYWTRFGLPISIAIAFCSVAILAIITFKNTVTLRNGERQVSRSHAIGEATHRLLSALKDVQTGERGYLITGKQIFLEPYTSGKIELDDSWRELHELSESDESLRAQVASLKDLLDRKIAYLDQAVAVRSRDPSSKLSDELIEMVKSEGGEKLMEAVRQATNAILSNQSDRLHANEQRSNELSSTSYRAILLGNLIALAIIMTTGAISYLDRQRRDCSEANLAAKESELSAIFSSTSDAILSFDNQGRVRLMNPAARQLLGVMQSESAIGSMLDGVIQPEGKETSIQGFVESDLQSRKFRGYGKHIEGKQFPISGRFAKVDADGNRYNILLFQDLTEIQRAESSRRELAAILDQVTDAIVVCDMLGLIVSWNCGAIALHNVSTEQAVGKYAKDLLCAESPWIWENGTTHIQNHPAYTIEFDLQELHQQKRWIEHRHSLIRDSLGAPIGQLVMQIDITERRQEEARQRRSQRLESIGTLAGGVAHDLNNILTPILMNAKLAQRSTTNQTRLLETIVTSAERGGKMIKKLLAFAGGERASLELVDVRDVVYEVQEILNHSLPKTIALTTELAEDLYQVQADPTELSQVLVNLAINARDAMPDGGLLSIVARNYRREEPESTPNSQTKNVDFVILSVIDQGHGISPEIQERIFDPFFTTKAQGKGTGLGLATSLGIVRAYGGDISVDSAPGKGSTFSVYLPVSSLLDSAGERSQSTQEEPPGNGETILLIDDEPSIVESASELLEKMGYRVLNAIGGSEAIEKVSDTERSIDVVLLDMMMPDMDGIETKRRLRALQPKLKIIGSSGLKRPRMDEGLDDLDGFLSKPYTNQQLLQLIRQTLDNTSLKD